MKLAKEYETFITAIDQTPLSKEDRNKLKRIGREWPVVNKALNKIKNDLIAMMLNETLDQSFVRWALFTLAHMKGLFK